MNSTYGRAGIEQVSTKKENTLGGGLPRNPRLKLGSCLHQNLHLSIFESIGGRFLVENFWKKNFVTFISKKYIN